MSLDATTTQELILFLTRNAQGATPTSYDALFLEMLSTNVSYLGISVGIIISLNILGGLWLYLFNFKPLTKLLQDQKKLVGAQAERLDKQEIDIAKTDREVRIELEEKIKKQDQAFKDSVIELKNEITRIHTEELSALKQKIKEQREELQFQLDLSRITNKWNEQYIWKAQKVVVSEINCICEAIEEYFQLQEKYKIDNGLLSTFLDGFKFTLEDEATIKRLKEETMLKEKIKKTMNKILNEPKNSSLYKKTQNILRLLI